MQALLTISHQTAPAGTATVLRPARAPARPDHAIWNPAGIAAYRPFAVHNELPNNHGLFALLSPNCDCSSGQRDTFSIDTNREKGLLKRPGLRNEMKRRTLLLSLLGAAVVARCWRLSVPDQIRHPARAARAARRLAQSRRAGRARHQPPRRAEGEVSASSRVSRSSITATRSRNTEYGFVGDVLATQGYLVAGDPARPAGRSAAVDAGLPVRRPAAVVSARREEHPVRDRRDQEGLSGSGFQTRDAVRPLAGRRHRHVLRRPSSGAGDQGRDARQHPRADPDVGQGAHPVVPLQQLQGRTRASCRPTRPARTPASKW